MKTYILINNTKYKIDFNKLTQSNVNCTNGCTRKIRRVNTDENHSNTNVTHQYHSDAQKYKQKTQYVWQFQNNRNIWKNYDKDTAAFLESRFNQNPVATFSCMTSRNIYYIDLKEKTQTNQRTGNERPIRRQNIKDSNETKYYKEQNAQYQKYIWEWQRGKDFRRFNATTSNEMERLFQTGATEYKFKNSHNNQMYTIKFNQLKQYNDSTKNARNIRRMLNINQL